MKFSFFRNIGICALIAGVFFVLKMPRSLTINPGGVAQVSGGVTQSLPEVPEATSSSPAAVSSTEAIVKHGSDIANQQPLANPPNVVKAVYLTGWSAGSTKKVDATIDLIKRTELNAVVIDVKDYSGYVSYAMDIPEVKLAGADREPRIASPNAVIKKLHDNNVYAIARITVFQDPLLAKLHPEWAMKNKTTGKTWEDSKGLAWMDPGGTETWRYIVSIAKDALARGFDEINFDYVRFASDGSLHEISYPFWDEKTARHKIIGKFFKYLRDNLGEAKLSADLFGLATVNRDDLGIGQVIEDAYQYFDYVSPMVYPSHYATGFLGYKNPGAYPYEVMKYSLDHALTRLLDMSKPKVSATASSTTSTVIVATEPVIPPRAKLRPWIQDFNLGAVYDAPMVKKEFQATYDSLENSSTSLTTSGSTTSAYGGWLIWSPSNNYTVGALNLE